MTINIKNINIKPNQTLKDFNYGRKFVKGLASRSIAPVILLEAFVEGGRTYQAYKRGGYTEARERLTEEMLGAAFWFSGVPLFNNLIDKYIGKKLLNTKDIDFDTGSDNVRKPVKNFLIKHKELLENPQKAEKLIAHYKFGKVMTSIILANCLVGFVLPKTNQAITKYLLKKGKDKKTNGENQINYQLYKMDNFITPKKEKVTFGAISPQTLMTLAYSFENNPKYGLLSTDMGVWVGRGVCARNNHERTEVLFRDISSSYFYMFNMPVVAAILNKIMDGKTNRLDPIAAKQTTDLMKAVLNNNEGTMTKENFEKAMFGTSDNNKFLTAKIKTAIKEGKGTVEINKFIDLLEELDTSKSNISEFKTLAKKMSKLQPALAGKQIITEKQIQDIFTGGAINIPEFLENVFRCSTSDQNLFTGRISAPVYDQPLRFISKETFIKKQDEIKQYIESVIKKAKGGEITNKLIDKACRENYIKNGINWGIGFAISATFLSTFIPKIQYWITRKVTGSNAFPGTADYSNETKTKK